MTGKESGFLIAMGENTENGTGIMRMWPIGIRMALKLKASPIIKANKDPGLKTSGFIFVRGEHGRRFQAVYFP